MTVGLLQPSCAQARPAPLLAWSALRSSGKRGQFEAGWHRPSLPKHYIPGGTKQTLGEQQVNHGLLPDY